MGDNLHDKHIITKSVELYQDQPKDLQVEAVASLVQGKHTFVQAGTGFGKMRISEMFFGLFNRKVIVLVLNPLDSLGNDQVREKTLVKITAINLNKMTLDKETVEKIKKGAFSFVYLSPEVFLNSSLFTDLFFSKDIQNMLALIVIDEAHMIYLWGLVASKQSKFLSSFATCRPLAVSSITTSLMLLPSDINMVEGKLTRPEFRFIWINMNYTLNSCKDLLRIFAPQTATSASDAFPTIIYSGTRNRTLQAMKVLNEARGSQLHEYDHKDDFIQRFHSNTSDIEKTRTMEDFGAGNFPVILATMALGLGQNLKQVQCVIHMGRADPASIVQMVEGVVQTNDVRMDALAVTNLCLRVALTVDKKVGHIALLETDPSYLAEKARELSLNFPRCKCSNCMRSEADALLNIIRQVNINNFDLILDDPFSLPLELWNHTLMQHPKKKPTKATCSYSDAMAHDLKIHLVERFEVFYNEMLGQEAEFKVAVFFGMDEAKMIVKTLDQVRNGDCVDITLLATLMGGQMFEGVYWTPQQPLVNGTKQQQWLKKKAKEKLRIQEEKARIAQEKAAGRQSKAAENERIKEEKAKLKALAVEARRHKATIAKASKKSEQEARLKAKEDARVLAADDLKKKKRAQADSIEEKKVAAQAKRVDFKRHQEDKQARNTLVMSQIQEHRAQLLHRMEDGE
ncbi:hypothetical protein PCANC_27102 [Puccinia coronata f. sp. avenae]|uniref:DNA 3'-5' helicase n=1 Tax=Puccinia coronata f. sp. avenae TaxID=200324 RepID=A0A2N5S7K0_9BASI|nr:hypothetical protein PCANC_27102 [Puccinia coronata f. sp. avenae]